MSDLLLATLAVFAGVPLGLLLSWRWTVRNDRRRWASINRGLESALSDAEVRLERIREARAKVQSVTGDASLPVVEPGFIMDPEMPERIDAPLSAPSDLLEQLLPRTQRRAKR